MNLMFMMFKGTFYLNFSIFLDFRWKLWFVVQSRQFSEFFCLQFENTSVIGTCNTKSRNLFPHESLTNLYQLWFDFAKFPNYQIYFTFSVLFWFSKNLLKMKIETVLKSRQFIFWFKINEKINFNGVFWEKLTYLRKY